jgi:hypothetical protein
MSGAQEGFRCVFEGDYETYPERYTQRPRKPISKTEKIESATLPL